MTASRVAAAERSDEGPVTQHVAPPVSPLAANVLALQRTAGNRAVAAMLGRNVPAALLARSVGTRRLMRDPPNASPLSAGGSANPSGGTSASGRGATAASGTSAAPAARPRPEVVVTGGGTVAGVAGTPDPAAPPAVPNVQLPPPTLTGNAPPAETGSTPSPSSQYQGSTINNRGTLTLGFGLGGVSSGSPLLLTPPVYGYAFTYSPLDWLQTQFTASNTGMAGQLQLASPTPQRLNVAYQLNAAATSGQNAARPEALIPSFSQYLIVEVLAGGHDPQHPIFVLGGNWGVSYTPFAGGLLRDAVGTSGSLGATLTPFGYYHDAPSADPTDHRPVDVTGTARWAFGLAGNYSVLWGNLQNDPTATATLRNFGLDASVTWVSPNLSAPSRAPVRFFVSVNSGPRWVWFGPSHATDTNAFGWSAGFNTGFLFGSAPAAGH